MPFMTRIWRKEAQKFLSKAEKKALETEKFTGDPFLAERGPAKSSFGGKAPKREAITQAQYKALVERLMGEGKGELSPSAASTIMSRYEPPVEREYGALREVTGEKWPQPMYAPMEEARKLAFEQPQKWAPAAVRKPTERLYKTPAGDIAYERMKFGQIYPPKVRQVAEAAAPEDAFLSPMLVLATEGDWLWRNVLGGRKGTGGQIWKNIYEGAPLRKHFTDEKDYFVSTYVKYRTTPQNLEKTQKREANFLKVFVEPQRPKWEAEVQKELEMGENVTNPKTVTEDFLK